MSDNTTLNPGSGGDTYASDDIDGIKYQRVKLVAGPNGTNDGDISASSPLPIDIGTTVKALLQALANPVWQEVAGGRLRVVLDPLGGAQTLGTVTAVTTVTTLTSMSQIAGVAANGMVYDTMHNTWAVALRGRIT